MTIEIRELIIQAKVEAPEDSGRNSLFPACSNNDEFQLIEQIVEKVIERLRESEGS